MRNIFVWTLQLCGLFGIYFLLKGGKNKICTDRSIQFYVLNRMLYNLSRSNYGKKQEN